MKNKKKYVFIVLFESFFTPETDEKEKSKVLPENKELYRHWRGIQRDQLGISANLYMVFASAILGYAINFLVENKGKIIPGTIVALSISLCFLLLSLTFYGWFTHNRLKDFRKTAKFLKTGKTEDEVSDLTSGLGELTWNLYNFQRYSLIAGFFICLIGFCTYIYS